MNPPDLGNRDRFADEDLRCFGADSFAYAQSESNFAGHYVIGACTCGSGCHYLFMWDALTGKFYQRVPPGVIDVGPYEPGGVEYAGDQFQIDSSLLIVEGCVEDTCACACRYYNWNGRKFR